MKLERLVVTLLSLSTVQCLWYYDVYYKWKTIEYNIPPYVQLNSSAYEPRNNIISQVKIYENRMWITTPSYLRGVPVTLSTLPYNPKYHWWTPFFTLHDQSPKLQPFPSYEMNKMGDCNALQLVSAIEIDQFGRLWVIDVGRVYLLEQYEMSGTALNLCPAKLMIFDVRSGRSKLLSTYTFPDDVAPSSSSFLKGLQLACETRDDCWAFIPDSNLTRIVVYDHKNRQSWTAEHPSMKPDPYKIHFLVNGVPVVTALGINSIALAPKKYDFSELYFSPLASTTLYKIQTECLKNSALKQNGTLRMDDVIDLGEIPGQSDGFAMSSKGELFYGNLPDNSILSTDTSPELTEIDEQKTVARSDIDFLWPDGFGFDGKGKLAVTTTKFHLRQRTDPEDYNFRVVILRHTGHVYSYNHC
ncbi:major royal jelly protein 1-like [Bradysia coprophila]|uniref:major royal jelly protein 1-like n=1 Tax=Bradysia coprophila TaxID=38358 RepID=UPI00187D8539|nr:major royal jelly protein 1-like [Bradysia coprophila]